MGHSTTSGGTKQPLGDTKSDEICVSTKEAFRRLGIGRTLGNRLIRTGEIQTIKLGGRRLVPVNKLNDAINRRIETKRTCQTCKRKDNKGKCAAFSSKPDDISKCWTDDPHWNIWVVAETNEYQGRVEKKKK